MKQRPQRTPADWLILCVLLALLSYTTQDYLPRGGVAPIGLGPPPMSIINQEKGLLSQIGPQANLMKAVLQLDSSFPERNVKLTETISIHLLILWAYVCVHVGARGRLSGAGSLPQL